MLTALIILAVLALSIALALGVATSVMSVIFHFMKAYSVTPIRVPANH